jgi:hypothetical protein
MLKREEATQCASALFFRHSTPGKNVFFDVTVGEGLVSKNTRLALRKMTALASSTGPI